MFSSKLSRYSSRLSGISCTREIVRHHNHASILNQVPITCEKSLNGRELATPEKAPPQIPQHDQEDDHRSLGTTFSLFTTHPSCPGSPLFLPDGTHILQKLQAFLRAQYPAFGFQEVITPIMYKKSLWKRSGHWENYKSDMFTVTGGSGQTLQEQKLAGDESNGGDEYGLKPMNCPGHCLLFQSQKRSYRELPIRYADFSPLHRNEISGSLSGLTRLRRFHQDDGHIFCRPAQVGQEIEATLEFVRIVYETFDLGNYKLVLSTRPETQFIGTVSEWERAEAQLKVALVKSGRNFSINEGDGAFYGPKIDVILTDSDGKEHQTATIQLDFQLPQRFGLEYQSPAPEREAQGLITTDPGLLALGGMVTPVIIHRAVLGSLERFMALLIEHYRGHWPFWLSPRQVIILIVQDDPALRKYAHNLAGELRAPGSRQHLRQLDARTFTVEVDDSSRSLAKKVWEAKQQRYSVICVIGTRNMQENTLDLTFSGGANRKQRRKIIDSITRGSRAPLRKESHAVEVTLKREELKTLMMRLCDEYV